MGLLERFMAKVSPEPTSGCWLWTGTVNGGGYGTIGLGSRAAGKRAAHRVAYELFQGPIPQGMDARHSCDLPACVNPDHIQPGTRSENMIESARRGRCHNVAKTECPHGHPYSPANTYYSNKGRRQCKTCHNAVCVRYQRAQRASRDR